MDRLTELADSAVALRISYDRYLHEFMVALILLITISGDYLVVRYVIGRMLREVLNLLSSAASYPIAHQLHPKSQGHLP